ncbi:MAG: hypothetical protein JO106_04290 [Mycobacterium sp.]|nr:hypothetical protein [Mycobacterium sp.]
MAMDESADWMPPTCTLPTAERARRLAEFDELFGSGRWYQRTATTQLDLAIAPEATPRARGLAERESRCCSFFSFEFEALEGDVVMHIGVPASQVAVLDALQTRVAAAIAEARR